MVHPFRRRQTEADVAERLSFKAMYGELEVRFANALLRPYGSMAWIVGQTGFFWVWMRADGLWGLHDPYPYLFMTFLVSIAAAYNGPLIGITTKLQDYRAQRRHEESAERVTLMAAEVKALRSEVKLIASEVRSLRAHLENRTES